MKLIRIGIGIFYCVSCCLIAWKNKDFIPPPESILADPTVPTKSKISYVESEIEELEAVPTLANDLIYRLLTIGIEDTLPVGDEEAANSNQVIEGAGSSEEAANANQLIEGAESSEEAGTINDI
ncbi:hypothetical protein SASPL_115228 [Salvia splendens]|uniref:Uncharacterized protein n=1 Tax=Salvia splendens TaxID=180675 RepID=A0A8X8Y2U1_SALSN|nr:hypothetical protein SASPL_115228 [Salvia splendens]